MADLILKNYTPEQYAEKINELKQQGKMDELVELLYAAEADAVNLTGDDNLDKDIYKRVKVYEDFLKEITDANPVKDENGNLIGKELKPENKDFYMEFMKKMAERYYAITVEEGIKRDAWAEKIKKGKVKGTELLKDDPGYVKTLAHDILLSQDEDLPQKCGNFINKLISKNYGLLIDGKSGVDVFADVVKQVEIDLEKKHNISSEKMIEYANVFQDKECSSSLKFSYKKADINKNESPIVDIPDFLKVIQNCKTSEELDALEDSLKAKIDTHDHFERQIKSVVKVSKNVLNNFESITWPKKKVKDDNGNLTGEEEEYLCHEDLHHCMEHFTHLGTDYKYESTEILSEETKKTQAKNLSFESEIYVPIALNACELVERSLEDMFDNASDRFYELEEANKKNTKEYQIAKSMVEATQDTFTFKETAKKIAEDYETNHKDCGKNDISNAKKILKYIKKAREQRRYPEVPEFEGNNYTRDIDKVLNKLSDSLADCGVHPENSDRKYDKLAEALMEHKRIYRRVKMAELAEDDKLKTKYIKKLATNTTKLLKCIKNCKSFEKSTNRKEGIINGIADRKTILDDLAHRVEREFTVYKNASEEVSYDKYIRLHAGKYSGTTVGEKKKNIAKVMAAYSLKKEGKKFDLKAIHNAAKEIEEFYCIRTNPRYDTTKGGKQSLINATKNSASMIQEATKVRIDTYGIKNGKYDEFLNDMKVLKDSMRTSEGRTTLYKNLCNAIKVASELGSKTANMTDEQKADAFATANINVVLAVQKYVKGKETVRISDKGNDAFHNSMDALAIVSKYTKHEGLVMNESVAKVLDKINDVRHDNILSMYSKFDRIFGAKRAKNDYNKRMQAEEANRNNKVKKSPVK